MSKFTVYYSVQNGGDGSAYPSLFESAELASWDQDNMYEGWAEDCSGSFSFESESPINCLEEIITKEGYFFKNYFNEEVDEDLVNDFIKLFFPEGFPNNFVLGVQKIENQSNFLNVIVCLNDKIVTSFWNYVEDDEVPVDFKNKLQSELNELHKIFIK